MTNPRNQINIGDDNEQIDRYFGSFELANEIDTQLLGGDNLHDTAAKIDTGDTSLQEFGFTPLGVPGNAIPPLDAKALEQRMTQVLLSATQHESGDPLLTAKAICSVVRNNHGIPALDSPLSMRLLKLNPEGYYMVLNAMATTVGVTLAGAGLPSEIVNVFTNELVSNLTTTVLDPLWAGVCSSQAIADAFAEAFPERVDSDNNPSEASEGDEGESDAFTIVFRYPSESGGENNATK